MRIDEGAKIRGLFMRHKMTTNSIKIEHSQWHHRDFRLPCMTGEFSTLFVLLFKENMINFAMRYTTLRQRRAIQRRSTISTAQLGVMLLVPRSRAGG